MIAKSAFTWHDPTRPCSKHSYMAVPHRSGTIQIYELSRHPVRKREELQVHHEDNNPGRINILKVAFAPGSKDLGVLCTQDSCLDEGVTNHAKRFGLTAGSKSTQYKLVVFHRLYAKQKGHFFSSEIQETRDILFPNRARPVGFALAQNGSACIVCRDGSLKSTSMIWVAHRHDKLMETCSYDPSPRMSPIDEVSDSYAISNVQFNLHHDTLLLFEAGRFVHSWTATVPDVEDRPRQLIRPSRIWIDVDKEEGFNTWKIEIGKPFYERHTSDILDPNDDNQVPQCRRSWLALGFGKPPGHDRVGDRCDSVFVMQSTVHKNSINCDHLINLDGRTSWWKVVALLGGYRQGESTLGTVMAVSPDGTRIAAAVWGQICLWTLDPKLLVEGDLQLYFPPRDYNARKDIGRLRPTVLSRSCNVVHGMQWTNEEVLFAITDRGLLKWDLGCMSDGTTEDLSMIWDTWPTNALSVPAPGSGDVRIPSTLQGLVLDD